MFYFLHQVTLSLLQEEQKQQQHQQTTSTTPPKNILNSTTKSFPRYLLFFSFNVMGVV